MIQHGFDVGGTNRIVASSVLFILWALFATFLLKLNGEALSAVGLGKPRTSFERSYWVCLRQQLFSARL